MEQPRFDESLRTGFEAIDEQHRLFLDMLAELGGQLTAGQHRQGVLDAFQGMRLYADGHFTEEEALMASHAYPELEAHRRLHRTFRAMARELEERFGEGEGLVSLETLEFLGAWFIGHIRNEDQRFAAHVRGRKPSSSQAR
jgi:hemerythrin-like metal-binding protein